MVPTLHPSGRKQMENGTIFDAEGYMATGWINVGGVDYCLAPDGALYVSCTTPDGYNVDANGAWIH